MRLTALRSVALAALLLPASSGAEPSPVDTDRLWTTLAPSDLEERRTAETWIEPRRFHAVALDGSALDALLAATPLERTPAAELAPTVLHVPRPDGGLERFAVAEAPVMAPDLAAWLEGRGFPMRTYRGRGLDRPDADLRFDWGGPAGFHGSVRAPGGGYFVDPAFRGDRVHYLSYRRNDLDPKSDHVCGVSGTSGIQESSAISALRPRQGTDTGGNLRTYRLAVAATGEYTAFHGGTAEAGQAAIVTTVNRINQIYNTEAAIQLTLIGNNQTIVYTDGMTDPYTNDDGGAMLAENQANLDMVIGTENYDVGHVVSTDGGGIATTSSPCNAATKARGVTGSAQPTGDPFDVDFVAHEIGHQFDGSHTFNSETGSCSGNRDPSHSYEPGSGSTIMAYAGICGAANNVQSNSDPYFHGTSLDQILTFAAAGGNCAALSSAGNANAPTVDAGGDFTIPVSTPFELTAASSSTPDASETHTFAWEQFDLGPAMDLSEGDTGDGPILRSRLPTSGTSRAFPALEALAAGVAPPGEILPTTDRTLTFRVTVRDNASGGGRVGEDTLTLTAVPAAGPFEITAPNGGELLGRGSGTTVSWNVAGTDSNGVDTAEVDIHLSVDGGATYPHALASATPNDGSEVVTLPSVSSSSARIRVRAVGNVFFDISDDDIEVGIVSQCATPEETIPDPGTLLDTISIGDEAEIADLDVTFRADHTWVGDLVATLTHVATGTSITLFDRPGYVDSGNGCGFDDLDLRLDDEAAQPVEDQCASSGTAILGRFSPQEALSAFDGESTSGDWRLDVEDTVSGDGGILLEWCLKAEVAPSAAPEISVSPTNHAFGFRETDDGASAGRAVTIRNDGAASLDLSSVQLTGEDPSDFSIDVDTGEASLAPGEERTVTLTFDPSTAGTKSAALRITSNDADEPTVDVGLAGVGVEPGATIFLDGFESGDTTAW